jgi:hypothetical protein
MTRQSSDIYDEKLEEVSGFLDGELTQQEAQKISLLIQSDPDYQKLYQELVSMRQEIQSLSLQDQELEHLDQLLKEPVAKTSRLIGFCLLFTGIVCVIGFMLFKIFTNPSIGVFEKCVIGAVSGGSLLLFFSVLRQRLIARKNDKYTGVKI